MASVFVRHRVADYAKWKPIFDEHEGVRRQYGFSGHSLHRDPDDPNVIIVALRVTDVKRAKEFAASEDLRGDDGAGRGAGAAGDVVRRGHRRQALRLIVSARVPRRHKRLPAPPQQALAPAVA